MQIQLNGEPTQLHEPLTVRELLLSVSIAAERCAVIVNGTVIRKADHETHRVNDGDTVELITMVGGG